MSTQTTSPALYVGTYAKYNAGSLGGAWLKLDDYSDRSEFLAACAGLHADESDRELMQRWLLPLHRRFGTAAAAAVKLS